MVRAWQKKQYRPWQEALKVPLSTTVVEKFKINRVWFEY